MGERRFYQTGLGGDCCCCVIHYSFLGWLNREGEMVSGREKRNKWEREDFIRLDWVEWDCRSGTESGLGGSLVHLGRAWCDGS